MPDVREIPFVCYGKVRAHAVSMGDALDIIAHRARSGEGGFVLTPNVDHIALSQRRAELAEAYGRSFLSLADGFPLVAASRLLGLPVREKVSGSDLFEPLMARCARERLPVFFLGATRDACESAVRKLRSSYPGIRIAGHESPFFDLDLDPGVAVAALRRARSSGARLIVACLPPMKQLVLHRYEHEYRPAVAIGAGSALSFYVGDVQRAPRWISKTGLEWLHRLSREPGRLWRRYLVEDLAAIPVLARMVLHRVRGHPLVGTTRSPFSHHRNGIS